MDFKVISPVAADKECVSLAEARQHVRLTSDDSTAEDGLFAVWITSARETAEHYTGLALAPQTLEAALDAFPDCSGEITLPMPPVVSITSIKYTDLNGVEQTLDPAKYVLSSYDNRTVSLAYGASWPSTRGVKDAVRIQFLTGYGNEGGPALKLAVKQAILLMIAWMFNNRGDEMSADDIQPPAAKALLNTVKQWGF